MASIQRLIRQFTSTSGGTGRARGRRTTTGRGRRSGGAAGGLMGAVQGFLRGSGRRY